MPGISIRSGGVEVSLAALLAGAALVLGGGGIRAPLPEMVLECLAVLAAALWIGFSARRFPFFAADRKAWVLAGLVLVLPAIQLIPLPPALWQAMAGRELTEASLALVGADDTWRPWSLTPDRTLTGLLAMIPAAMFVVMLASLGRGGRACVLAIIAAVACSGLLVGAVQMAGGEANAFRFYQPELGFLNGFQANHNAQADVLLIAMVGVAATLREYAEFHPGSRLTRGYRLGLTIGATLLLSFSVVLTASRVGIALLPIAWAGVLAILWPLLRFDLRKLAIGAAGLFVLAVIALALVSQTTVMERIMARFDFEGELRPQIWRDSLYVAQLYFPWGSGVGSYVPVFIAAEPLEVIDPTLTNRAHNDYLELLVEAGVFGVMLLTAISWSLAGLARQALRKAPAGSRGQVVFSITTLAVIALHSIVDYPLRTMSLSFIAAAAAALLMPLPDRGETGDENA